MLLRFNGRLNTFEYLFDEIDAAARAVQLVSQHLICGAGCSTKTAVHAGAQDCVSLNAVGRVFYEVG